MIIDISSYNGDIDFNKLIMDNEIERVIMRSTIKTGDPDSKLVENIQNLKSVDDSIPIDFYKFTYAHDFGSAYTEAFELCMILKALNQLNTPEVIYLDLEPVNGHIHSEAEAKQIIAAYDAVFKSFGVTLGIYANYSYLKTVIPDWAAIYPIWAARWSNTLGDISPFKADMWQYSSQGHIAGINGDVDLSRYC